LGNDLKIEDLNFFHAWFREYLAPLYNEDNYIKINIKLKDEHTHRVCKNTTMIGRDLNVGDKGLLLGETIALFHDIGRFEQFKKYRTFNDRYSENHAKLSIEVLEKHGILTRLEEEERAIIYKAIEYHNVRKLPSDEHPDALFYARLLRDADKLDILYLMTEYFEKRHILSNPAIELDLPDRPECSEQIINDIMNCKCADWDHVKTYNDMKLLELSWVFDINFPSTLRYIRDLGYTDKIINVLPDTDEIRKVQQHINEYVYGITGEQFDKDPGLT
jgi:hypothetical protein